MHLCKNRPQTSTIQHFILESVDSYALMQEPAPDIYYLVLFKIISSIHEKTDPQRTRMSCGNFE